MGSCLLSDLAPGEGPSQPARTSASTLCVHGVRTGTDVTWLTHLRRETFVNSQWGGSLRTGLQRDMGLLFFLLSPGSPRIKAGEPVTLRES